jgi:hypothetical protein
LRAEQAPSTAAPDPLATRQTACASVIRLFGDTAFTAGCRVTKSLL